jgi:hypothetical protein
MQRPNGTLTDSNRVIEVRTVHGYSTLTEALLNYPPTIYFRDGSTARGGKLAPPPEGALQLPDETLAAVDWQAEGVSIKHEKRREGTTDSIHEWVDAALQWRYHSVGWIAFDDGSGEIADHFVIEPAADDVVRLHLVHSKASKEATAGLRVKDLDEVVGQIVRSRRWLERPPGQLWKAVAHRVQSRASTRLLGSGEAFTEASLLEACRKWIERPPTVEPFFVAVQPGLDTIRLKNLLAANSAESFAETIHSCLTWVGRRGSLVIVGS